MQVPSQFAPANAIDYLTWGVQALVPLVFFWVQGLVLIASFIGLQKLAAWAVQASKNEMAARVSNDWRRVMRPIAGVNPSGFAAASLVVAVLGWVGLTWSFADIFVTLGQLAENTGDAIIDVSVLSPASAAYHRLYGTAYAVLSFLIGVVF